MGLLSRAEALPWLLLLIATAALGAQPGEEGECSSRAGECRRAVDSGDEHAEGLRWSPKTLSVVLPCAGEGTFALRTVKSITKSTSGAGGEVLANIVVVDDGSRPPLNMTRKFQARHKVTLLRNEQTQGLIRAKSIGAAGATGDIIVFFDCHVAPQLGWHEEFLRESAENYRRIVVPQITDLDIDSWKERNRHSSTSKCYLTWDADFKWFTSAKPDIPVLSGGLLGISRRWWNETGGYDEGMRGWGGENIDQSLRTWLCGGEIKSLSNAFVAHMWRVPEDMRTQPRYRVNRMHTLENRKRAALGWFDDFAEKLAHYPDLGLVKQRKKDVAELHAVRRRLSCRPFAWFLWRFRDVYEDAGLLPNATFHIQHLPTKHCLTYLGPAGTHPMGSDKVQLQRCGKVERSRRWPSSPPDPQRWHRANQDPRTGHCCSGLRVWSTDQCLSWSANEQTTTSAVCDIAGRQGMAAVSGTARQSGLASGKLVLGAGCLTASNDGQLRWAACKTVGAGEWEEVGPEQPIETGLYWKARKEQPDLFRELDSSMARSQEL